MENRIEQGNKSRISRQRLTDFGWNLGWCRCVPRRNTVSQHRGKMDTVDKIVE